MIYKDRVQLLLDNKIIESIDEVFFPKHPYYTELSNFFQSYLESKYDLTTPIFIFGSEESLNAWACPYNGLNVICINKCVIDFVHIFDKNKDFIFEYLSNNRMNVYYDNVLPANTIMKQMIEMFLFYHELGHLIQAQDPSLSTGFVDEVVVEDSEYDLIDHVAEVDADLFAAIKLATHITEIYKREKNLKTEREKIQYIEDLCIIATSSYVIYRFYLFPYTGDFYTKKTRHPHLVLRINFLILHLTKSIIDYLELQLDRERIVDGIMDFAETFINLFSDSNIPTSFIEMGRSNIENIKNYMLELNGIVVTLDSTAHVKSQKKIKNV